MLQVTLKAGGITTVNDDVIKGTLRVGSTVEVKQDPKKEAMEAVITKIQDCSQYTVGKSFIKQLMFFLIYSNFIKYYYYKANM